MQRIHNKSRQVELGLYMEMLLTGLSCTVGLGSKFVFEAREFRERLVLADDGYST